MSSVRGDIIRELANEGSLTSEQLASRLQGDWEPSTVRADLSDSRNEGTVTATEGDCGNDHYNLADGD